MGCVHGTKGDNDFVLKERFIRAIESSNIHSITSITQKYLKKCSIDDIFTEVQGLALNPLAYSLWVGKLKSFFFLHKSLHANIKSMELLFEKYEISSLHIICAKGYTDLLSYFLPFYIEEMTEFPEVQEVVYSQMSYLLCEDSILIPETKPKFQPIHLATIQEQTELLMFVHKFFETRAFIPKTLDFEYKEALSGENCALLACRCGKYKIIKLLHQTCKVSFRVKNHRELNAINVLIEGSRERIDSAYFNCLEYLVEVVCLDVEYNYEFNLLWAEDEKIVKYLERKLKDIGIVTSKKQVQENNAKAGPKIEKQVKRESSPKIERPVFQSVFESELDT